MDSWTLTIPGAMWADLRHHLFPGDGDEHGAVIGAGIVRTDRGVRLLARWLHCALDGIDYVPGERGYRMLTPSFVGDQILQCSTEGLAYLAVHCHGGSDQVGFSPDDMASHERGYPALLDIADGRVVGGLVFARNAVAGDIWHAAGGRVELTKATVAGRPARDLFPASPTVLSAAGVFDRQARIFGDEGQAILGRQKVGIIGAGGGGSLIVEYLARLGVGHLVVIDPDHVDLTNLPRIVGATRHDARTWLTHQRRPAFLRRLGERLATPKVRVAGRVARQANPAIRFDAIEGNVVDDDVARMLVDCDHIFLAADSMQARLVFNAIVHQYLIPGTQVGAKVTVDRESGEILDVFSVVRPVTPDLGCLWCNGLVSAAGLQEEAISHEERERQRYVDDPVVAAPSVITLNAVAAAHAVDDYLFLVTGLLEQHAPNQWLRFTPRDGDVKFETPRKDPMCRECGAGPRAALAVAMTVVCPLGDTMAINVAPTSSRVPSVKQGVIVSDRQQAGGRSSRPEVAPAPTADRLVSSKGTVSRFRRSPVREAATGERA